MAKIKILSVFGTRPEAIKMCPLVKALQATPQIESLVCVTGQHREMLDQVLSVFDISPDYDLNIMKPSQTLATITTSILESLTPVLEQERPNMILVHGDTTTCFACALAAFYQQIPIGHVEAGLRTYDMYSPFPEELNRVLTSRLATLHFAPTALNKANLVRENILDRIFVTGNTVLDSFKTTVTDDYKFKSRTLRHYDFSKRVILLTAHRRENIGEPLQNICDAVNEITARFSDVRVIYPVHLNPAVSKPVHAALGKNPHVQLLDPVDVCDLHNLMKKCHFIMTDSGGLQEEGPSFQKPVICLRTETERPEAVEAGCVKIAGVKKDDIVAEASRILSDEAYYSSFTQNPNPYGDGNASRRIVDAILGYFLRTGL